MLYQICCLSMKLLSINLCLGIPQQCFDIIVDSGSYIFWVTDIKCIDQNCPMKKYDRNKSTNSLASLLAYHQEMWNFHIKLHDAHPYMAKAWTWLFLGRPTAFYFTQPNPPAGTCTVGKCADSILAIGTPILWWISIVAIIYSLYVLLVRRDHKVLLPLLLLGAGWLPWFFVGERTIFYFYAVLLSPWLVILTTYLFIKTVLSIAISTLKTVVWLAILLLTLVPH